MFAVGTRAWASGVGYGHGRTSTGEVWNAKKSHAAQAAQDSEIQRLFVQLETDLREALTAGEVNDCLGPYTPYHSLWQYMPSTINVPW